MKILKLCRFFFFRSLKKKSTNFVGAYFSNISQRKLALCFWVVFISTQDRKEKETVMEKEATKLLLFFYQK